MMMMTIWIDRVTTDSDKIECFVVVVVERFICHISNDWSPSMVNKFGHRHIVCCCGLPIIFDPRRQKN